MKKATWMSKLALLAVTMLVCLGLGAAPAMAGGPAKVSGMVNLNTASAKQLQVLPGIGAKKAQAIVTARSAKRFSSVDDLVKVKGIGKRMLQKLRPYLRVSGPNTIKSLAKARKKKGARSRKG